MKTKKILLTAALLSLGIVSCQKDTKMITHFTANMERSDIKTYLDANGRDIDWEEGDSVMVYNGTESAVFIATPRTGNLTAADLTGTIAEGSQYTAIYPANIAVSATSVALPAKQTSDDGNLVKFPMHAQSSNHGLQFKNLCGALELQISQNCTISRVEITAMDGQCLNGTFPVSMDNGLPVLGDGSNGTTTTTLELTNPQSNGSTIYVYLPAKTYQNLKITFYQPDESYASLYGNITILRSHCHPVIIDNLTFHIPPYFTVGINKRVRFAWGNLKYNYSTNTNGTHPAGTWTFFDEQYGYQKVSSNSDEVRSNDPYTSLFSWSYGDSIPGYAEERSNQSVNVLALGTGSITNGSDWGTNAIYNAGNRPNMWRTLTASEWSYLLETRTNAGSKYSQVKITGTEYGTVYGLIILPDNWTAPSGVPQWRSGFSDDGYKQTYTKTQWENMEAAGAVFLPAAGYRSHDMVQHTSEEGDSYEAYYWTANTQSGSPANAYTLYFKKGDYGYGSGTLRKEWDKYYGCSVRLVRDVPIINNN